jgi:hypothetical protein
MVGHGVEIRGHGHEGLCLIIVVAIKPSTIAEAEHIADVIATTEPS